MSTDTGKESTTLSPDDAFAALGNETRMEILQTMGQAEGPLSFSELRDRVGIRDSGQFNYHLDQLDEHFVRKSDDGYELRQAGNRVVEAVLSGAVTESIIIEPTRLDAPCPYCGADIQVSYREERLLVRCTECTGAFSGIESTSGAFGILPDGAIALYYLPSAGLQGRTLREILNAVLVWTHSEQVANGNGVCPRCSGKIAFSYDVCEGHNTDTDVCDQCGLRYAITVESQCSNCNLVRRELLKGALRGDPTVRSFFETHGVDTLAPDWEDYCLYYNYEEKILSMDPFEARITFTIDGDALTLTVDDDLNVVDVTEHKVSDPA